jgi:hypothetical protein
MNQYNHYIQKMDPDSIALLFTLMAIWEMLHETVKVSGTFTATWVHSKSGWHLKRMLTKPVNLK